MPGLALPDGAALQVDGVPTVATTEIRKVLALGDCDTMSFVSAIVQCTQLGLEPGGALGHAYHTGQSSNLQDRASSTMQVIVNKI